MQRTIKKATTTSHHVRFQVKVTEAWATINPFGLVIPSCGVSPLRTVGEGCDGIPWIQNGYERFGFKGKLDT